MFVNLPDPPDIFLRNLEDELYRFLWDDKPSKIKKSVVCKTYEEGGLKMCNIYSFLTAMKLGWLRRLELGGKLREFTFAVYPILNKINIFGGEYANVVMQNIQNAFWKDVMKHYKKIYLKATVTDTDEFLSECIHYNINVTRDKKVIHIKEWCEQGIIKIGHIVNAEGNLMTFNEFKVKYPCVNTTNFLTFEGILKAIKQYQQKCNIQLTSVFQVGDSKIWVCLRKGNKYIQQMQNKSDIFPSAISKWNKLFINLNWKLIFGKCFRMSVDRRLGWFQARILHRLISTEKFLYDCKIADSPMCFFCKREIETIPHLFWQCENIHTFWEELLVLLKDEGQIFEKLTFTEELILFGMSENIVTDKVIDLIILQAKFYIFKCKLQKTMPVLRIFRRMLNVIYTDEKYLAVITGREFDFCLEWMPYMSVLN